jgi:hypothetical protein
MVFDYDTPIRCHIYRFLAIHDNQVTIERLKTRRQTQRLVVVGLREQPKEETTWLESRDLFGVDGSSWLCRHNTFPTDTL